MQTGNGRDKSPPTDLHQVGAKAAMHFLILLVSPALHVPFFDTASRIERTSAPPVPPLPNRYVPIYKGNVLVSSAADVVEKRLAERREMLLLGSGYGGLTDQEVDAVIQTERDRSSDLCVPTFLNDDQAAPLAAEDEVVKAWLGTVQEGELAAAVGPSDYWLLDLSHRSEPPAIEGGQWIPLRAASGPASAGGSEAAVLGTSTNRIESDDAIALLGTARGLGLWHRSVRFCSSCGSKTQPQASRHGRNRICTNEECKARFRPRLDPSVIVLVTKGDKCLLGRNKRWPEGRYSTLAGFVEFGETLEECVLREMEEEAGVRCDRSTLRFVASQPWLFPRSLMVGYTVEAADDSLSVDPAELEDAQWFDKEYVRAELARQGNSDSPALPGGFHVPSRISLARTIIESWLQEQ
jgi:NAD+ diphosphatase